MGPRNWWNIVAISDEHERASAITLFLKDVYNILNRGFTLKDNAKGALLDVTFSASNVDEQVRHGLDFAPQNYIVCGSSAAMAVYDGSVANDKTFAYLRSNATGSARIFFF